MWNQKISYQWIASEISLVETDKKIVSKNNPNFVREMPQGSEFNLNKLKPHCYMKADVGDSTLRLFTKHHSPEGKFNAGGKKETNWCAHYCGWCTCLPMIHIRNENVVQRIITHYQYSLCVCWRSSVLSELVWLCQHCQPFSFEGNAKSESSILHIHKCSQWKKKRRILWLYPPPSWHKLRLKTLCAF